MKFAVVAALAGSAAAATTSTAPPTYAPTRVACPAGSLNRVASALSPGESNYVAKHGAKANTSLASWIEHVNSAFDTSSTLPVVGFAASGGGYRAMLQGAGVLQAFDNRDSKCATSGLFQGLTYYSALSGGAWLMASLAGSNWPTISQLNKNTWAKPLNNGTFTPGGANNNLTTEIFTGVFYDDYLKYSAGFNISINDPWGRLLSRVLLNGQDNGVAHTFSGISQRSNFTSFNVPFPIMTSVGVDLAPGVCAIGLNATQYEFTPFEFGSWDPEVKMFTNIEYLGTNMSHNKPCSSQCVTRFDNLGFIAATSSDDFAYCGSNDANSSAYPVIVGLSKLVPGTKNLASAYAEYPNPFYKGVKSSVVSSTPLLTLTDGGLSGQVDPIWPFLQPTRSVNFLFVNDNSADLTNNLPNGTEIYRTYLRAQKVGMKKMPVIPPPATFVKEKLNTRATFFGCNTPDTLTIAYLPNVPYVANSNVSTVLVEFNQTQVGQIISNGNKVATQNGAKDWSECLACAMMKKTKKAMPKACTGCFAKWCYN